jgi:threonine dehydratase
MVDYTDIIQARERLAPYLLPTPLEAAPGLGGAVWIKLENVNTTHSFKIRGAMNAVLSLSDSLRGVGVIAASSGNHAQGLAYASSLFQVPAQILMPMNTPRRKVDGVRRYGAQAILHGWTYDDTELEARRLSHDKNLTYISPYNDAVVIAGAGTIGIEIINALPEVERVIVPVSGGGLAAGVATAIKAVNPNAEIIGVNALSAPAMYNFFYGDSRPQNWETLAEALSGEIEPGSITFEIVKRHVDQIVLVDEDAIRRAMKWMLTEQGWVVEGGGAVAVAAVLSGAIKLDSRPTVIIISGSNLDPENLQRVVCEI